MRWLDLKKVVFGLWNLCGPKSECVYFAYILKSNKDFRLCNALLHNHFNQNVIMGKVDNIEYENIKNLSLKKWLKSGELETYIAGYVSQHWELS